MRERIAVRTADVADSSSKLRSTSVRLLFGLVAAQVCLHSAVAGLRLSAPLAVLRSGLGQWAIGPLLGIFSAAPILVALPAGRLADRRGYHAPVRLAVALTVAAGALACLGNWLSTLQYPLLCCSALAAGAGANIGLITIQRTASRSAVNTDELKRTFSWLGLAPSVSSFLGPLLAGLLIDTVGFFGTFVVLSGLPLLALRFARLVPRDPGMVAPSPKARAASWDLLRGPMLRRLLFVNWCMSASWDVHSFAVPVLGEQRGLSASAIGAVLGMLAVAVTTVRLIIPVVAHRLEERRVMVVAMWVVAAVFALYPLAHSAFSMGLASFSLGLALGSSQPMVMTALHQLTPPERHGEAIALRSAVISTSSALLPLSFGAVGAALGTATLFWVMSGTLAAGSWVAKALRTHSCV